MDRYARIFRTSEIQAIFELKIRCEAYKGKKKVVEDEEIILT